MNTRSVIRFGPDDRFESVRALVDSLRPVFEAADSAQIDIELQASERIEPGSAALVAACCRQALERGCAMSTMWSASSDELVAFMDAYSLELWTQTLGGQTIEKSQGDTLAIERFYKERVDQPLRLLRMVRARTGLSDDEESQIAAALGEVFRNVEDHAKSPVGGFWAARFDPASRVVRAAVVDMGRGIGSTIRDAHPEIPSNSEALRRVLQGGVSAKSIPTNQGLGLSNLALIVRAMQGELLIFTEDVAAELGPGDVSPRISTLDARFPGTAIMLTLSLVETNR